MAVNTFFKRNGVLKLRSVFLVLFIFEMAVYFAISAIPYNNPALVSSLQAQQQAIYSQGIAGMIFTIFPHNLYIASIEFIPVTAV